MNVRPFRLFVFGATLLVAAAGAQTPPEGLRIGTLSAMSTPKRIVLALSEGLSGGTGAGYAYRIYRSTEPHFAPGPRNLIATVGGFPFTDDKGLRAGIVYYYKVVGVDGTNATAFALPRGTTTNPTERLVEPLATPACLATGVVNLVAIGDSITQGVIIGGENAPPVALAANLTARSGANVDLANVGISGTTTTGWLPGGALFRSATDAAARLTAAHPDGQLVFSIMLGTNDSAYGSPGTNRPATDKLYRANLKAIVDALLKACPTAKVFLHHPIWYSPNTRNGADYQEASLGRLVGFFPAIDGLVKSYGRSRRGHVYLGDTKAYAFFARNYLTELVAERASPGFGTFYLHPNVQGAVDLGRFQSEAISRVLF